MAALGARLAPILWVGCMTVTSAAEPLPIGRLRGFYKAQKLLKRFLHARPYLF